MDTAVSTALANTAHAEAIVPLLDDSPLRVVPSETVRYTYRLRPGAQAKAALLAEWGRCRWLWNEAVHQQKTGRKPTRGKSQKILTEARAQFSWLQDGSQNAQANTLAAYALALDHSFKVKGRRRPAVKRLRDSLATLEYTRNGFSLREGRLCLPKGTVIPVVWSRALPSPPTSCRVYCDSLGYWYVSFVVRRTVDLAPPAEGGIGIDWGISTTATTTAPAYDLPYGGYRKRCAAELAKAQRQMTRRRRPRGAPQSKGYAAARRKAAALNKKAARQNAHASRVWAKRVVDNHDLIAVEDFKAKFLAKSTMARKAADAAIGAAKRELIERGKRAGRRVVLVPPAYTTMTCSGCGTRAKDRLLLAERTFVCTTCGLIEGRDTNAARTILALAERGQVGTDDVRHLVSSSAGGRAQSEPGIP